MIVLIGCEFSGTMRDAFIKQGHDAISCDLLPTEAPGPHLQCDVFEAVEKVKPDLFIAHPSCQYLASSGLHWNKKIPGRDKLTEEAVEFVKRLLAVPVGRIAIENPIGRLSTAIRKPDFICHPFWYGDPESKATCFWTKNLPVLHPTNMLPKPASGRWNNQTPSGQNKLGPSPDRWKIRSTTYKGLANAAAEIWGSLGPFKP